MRSNIRGGEAPTIKSLAKLQQVEASAFVSDQLDGNPLLVTLGFSDRHQLGVASREGWGGSPTRELKAPVRLRRGMRKQP